MAGQFTDTVSDPRNPVSVKGGIKDDSQSTFIGQMGKLALDANVGIRTGMLRAKIEEEIDAYAAQDEAYATAQDTAAQNYSEQITALNEQTKEFNDTTEFMDPGITETEAQFRERADNLKQAYTAGRMSYSDLQTRIYNHLTSYIGGLPGEASAFRRVASEVLGDHESRLAPYKAQADMEQKLAYNALKAEQDFNIRAANLNMTPQGLRNYEAEVARYDLMLKRRDIAWPETENNILGMASTGMNGLVYQLYNQYSVGGELGVQQLQDIKATVSGQIEQLKVGARQAAARNGGADPSKVITQLDKIGEDAVKYLELFSKEGRLKELFDYQKQLAEYGVFMEYGLLGHAITTDADFVQFYSNAIKDRADIINGKLTGREKENAIARWKSSYNVIAAMYGPNDTFSEIKHPPFVSTQQWDTVKDAHNSHPRTNMDTIADQGKDKEKRKVALESLISSANLDDPAALEAPALDNSVFSALVADKELSEGWKNHVMTELQTSVPAIVELLNSPTVSNIRRSNNYLGMDSSFVNNVANKNLLQEYYEYLNSIRTNLQAYGPVWGIDADTVLADEFKKYKLTPDQMKRIESALGSDGKKESFFKETSVDKSSSPDTGQQDQDDIRRAFQQSNHIGASTAVDPVTGNPLVKDTGASLRYEDSASLRYTEGDEVITPQAEELIKNREGFRQEVYKDSLGKLTVGYGHLIKPDKVYILNDLTRKKGKDLKPGDKIHMEQIDEMFLEDGNKASDAAVKQAKDAGIEDADFIDALTSVNYQLGTNWTDKFYNSWPAIVNGNYQKAIKGIKSSRWARQTPERVEDFVKALEQLEIA